MPTKLYLLILGTNNDLREKAHGLESVFVYMELPLRRNGLRMMDKY